jgi:hypothetical protein
MPWSLALLLESSILSAVAGSESFIAINCISDNPISADNLEVDETGSISGPPSVASGMVSSSSSSYSGSVFVPSSDE